jgi:hypothetical protein
MLRTALAILLTAASAASGAERVVWQIGKPDRSYKEFAIAGDYPSYAKKFLAKPVVFEVGRSDPAADWPFIQPGPVDSWAGSRLHPRTIRFPLADQPQGVFKLRIELADVQAMVPPLYTVSIAGRTGQFRLPPGGGDASLTNPQAGKPHKIEIALPASMFKKGANEIVLTCAEGSWVQYDAVTLLNDPAAKTPEPDVQNLSVAATPFYIRRDGRVRRAVDVTATVTSPLSDLLLRVEAGGETIEVPVKPLSLFGSVSQEVGVPDVPGPMEVKVTATVAGRSKTATARIEPQRKWRIFVAPSSHTDVGYTDVQPKCAERHNQNIDTAIDLCAKYPDFKWNLEVAWQAENYLNSRKGKRLDDFLRLAKEGRIGVQALYANMLTGLCSTEEACRFCDFAHQLSRKHGIPYSSAMISDVPTQEASLPMILANSGIKYFSSGINNTRGPTFTQLYSKCPAWWEGPDGSRVLMMWVPGYAHASGWGMDQSVEAARGHVLGALRGYEARKDYPYDAVFLHGAVSDNVALNPKLAEVCKEWNERYEFPKIILCRNAEFFEHIEKNFADKLPVFRGSGGTYWEDGAGSSARETTMVRRAHETIANAEKLFALTSRIDPKIKYPRDDLYSAWRNCLLYDEHTWGAHCSIDQPESEFTKAQWKIKAQFAVDADKQWVQLVDRGVEALTSLVRTDGKTLVVFNPTNWLRSEVVFACIPPGTALANEGAPWCKMADTTEGSIVAISDDVASCGYKLKRLVPARPEDLEWRRPQPAEGNLIESRYYRVAFDPASGGITSIIDRQSGRELVDPKAPYRLNQYLYVAGGKGTRIVENGPEPKLTISTPRKATLHRYKLGVLGEMMVVETSCAMTPKITSTVYVWNDRKRIDIENRLTKTLTYDKEAAYFAFPFAAQKPTFRYEIPAGVVCANTDMLPGACLDWFTVQHFVEIESAEGAITWATPDTPLVCFQDINRGKWQTKLDFTNGHVYAYVMNNYWFTNYLAGQGGDFRFRFSITSRPKADRVASARFGWEASNPLVSRSVKANPSGPLTAPSGSLVSIDEPNVFLVGARRAAEGDGLILRLWELTGKPTTAHVRLPHVPFKKATACNLVEEPQGPLEIRDGTIAVPIRGSGLATVRVE